MNQDAAIIGYFDPVTLITHSKLSLNRNDDGYYRDHLVPLIHLMLRCMRNVFFYTPYFVKT